jgi:hypothetical protein
MFQIGNFLFRFYIICISSFFSMQAYANSAFSPTGEWVEVGTWNRLTSLLGNPYPELYERGAQFIWCEENLTALLLHMQNQKHKKFTRSEYNSIVKRCGDWAQNLGRRPNIDQDTIVQIMQARLPEYSAPPERIPIHANLFRVLHALDELERYDVKNFRDHVNSFVKELPVIKDLNKAYKHE